METQQRRQHDISKALLSQPAMPLHSHHNQAMFETSMRAGQAGHYQWGLDAGPHQNDWSPYDNRPAHWNRDDRDGSESELMVRTVVLPSGLG